MSEVLESDEETARAVADVLSILPEGYRSEFWARQPWPGEVKHEHSLGGEKVQVLVLKNGKLGPLADTTAAAGYVRKVERAVSSLSCDQRSVEFTLLEKDLVAVFRPGNSQDWMVAILTPFSLSAFLRASFPRVSLTPAIMRMLILALAGVGLTEGAALDGRSVDTRKRQAQHLRQAFDVEQTATILRRVCSALTLALEWMVNPPGQVMGKTLTNYAARYLPRETRIVGLAAPDGTTINVIDIGPSTGKPVIVLHAMALPDLREEDCRLLRELGLRLLWPLRNGLCAPEAAAMSPERHLEHAVAGISMVSDVFCSEKFQILSYAAASKVALAFVRRFPEKVSRLNVAAGCVLQGRPQGGRRKLARGVLALAKANPSMMDTVLAYLQKKLREPASFEEFIRGQFSSSASDLEIVEAEIKGRYSSERFREALLNSSTSTRHDFLFQQNLEWESAALLETEIQFFHGSDDQIHPLVLIEELAASLPGAKITTIANAGQLLYYQHLAPILRSIADRERG